MAFDTVRTNKMRSFLTVLGVVIGITSIVGMTAMIRGFDQSLRDLIAQSGPNIVYRAEVRRDQLRQRRRVEQAAEAAGPDRSPTPARSRQQTTTLQYVDIELGAGPGPPTQRRVFYRDQKTKHLVVFGTGENFAEGTRLPMLARPVPQRHGYPVPAQCLRAGQHCLQAAVRSERDRSDRQVRAHRQRALRGASAYSTSGRPPGGFNVGQDDFVVIPYSTYKRVFGLRVGRVGRSGDDHQS